MAPMSAKRRQQGSVMAGTTTPLYVVCSPCRCVGKTLVFPAADRVPYPRRSTGIAGRIAIPLDLFLDTFAGGDRSEQSGRRLKRLIGQAPSPV